MQMIDNARDVARRAWSVRLAVLAGIGEAVTLIYPMVGIDPPVWMSAVVFVLIVAGVVSRFIAQKGLSL